MTQERNYKEEVSLLNLLLLRRERLWMRIILKQRAKHFLSSLISSGIAGLQSGAETSQVNHEMSYVGTSSGKQGRNTTDQRSWGCY